MTWVCMPRRLSLEPEMRGQLSAGIYTCRTHRRSALHSRTREGRRTVAPSPGTGGRGASRGAGGSGVNWPSWLFSAFLATLALSTMLSLSQGLGLTRMNLPYLIGTLFTADREKAKVYGFFIHLVNGWAFS